MTWGQFEKLWNDYGAFFCLVAFGIIAIVTVITLTVKFWPVLTKVVSIGTAISTLPADIKDVRGDIGELAGRFDQHLVDVKAQTKTLGTRLETIEERQGVAVEKASIAAHQTTNNGGGSMKDAVDRTETRLRRIEELLLSSLPSDPAAGAVPLTATGTITLVPDHGAPPQ